MKLTFSPASPFARKVRIAAIELGLIDKIEFVRQPWCRASPTRNTPRITPLKKLPVLILDNGDVILDSYVIVEYLDELAGGGKLIPASGPARWKVKSDHSLLQGMLDSMLLCRYESMVRPQGLHWQAWSDDHWNRAWSGMARFEKQAEMLSRPARHLADRACLRARLCRFPLCRLRLAQGLSEARRLPSEDAGAAVGENLGAAAARRRKEAAMSFKFAAGDLTIHRIIEQETTFLPALELLPDLTPELLAENRALDARSRRDRRQRRADTVLPVLRREDAASHHPDRQLHRQRQAAAAAPEMEYED